MFAAAPLFTLTDLVPLAIFGLFAGATWFALEYFAAAKPRALERLEEIKNPQKRRSAQAEAILKKPDTVSAVLARTSALTKSFAPRTRPTPTSSRTCSPAPAFAPMGWCRSFTA